MSRVQIEILGRTGKKIIPESFLVHFKDDDRSMKQSILIDGGNSYSFLKNNHMEKLKKVLGIVVTHTHQDHLHGILGLLKSSKFKKKNNLEFIVFNCLENRETISYKQGSALGKIIREDYPKIMNLSSNKSGYDLWNTRDNDIWFLSLGKRDMLTDSLQKDKIYITFLTPTTKQSEKLQNDWLASYSDKSFQENQRIINEASIVLLIEYNGVKILLTGDQTAENIVKIFTSVASKNLTVQECSDGHSSRVKKWGIDTVDLIKIPHHGSTSSEQKSNNELSTLAELLDCFSFFVIPNPSVKIEPSLIESLQSSAKENEKALQIFSPVAIESLEKVSIIGENIYI